eukprot:6009872-Pyramimonas_sp.AAC.1
MENYGAFVEGISLVSDLQTNLTVIDINLDAVDIRSLANPDYFPGHHVALLSPHDQSQKQSECRERLMHNTSQDLSNVIAKNGRRFLARAEDEVKGSIRIAELNRKKGNLMEVFFHSELTSIHHGLMQVDIQNDA